MRLFIAADLNSSMKDELLYLAGQIKANSKKCSVTRQDNLHLTLAFIGECDEKEKVISALREVTFPSFDLILEGLGEFSRKGEKLIYGKMKSSPELMKLQKDISSSLTKAGITFDKKKFLPHITITRRTFTESGFSPSELRVEKISSPVNEFYLYSSDLSGSYPVYTKLAAFRCR